MVITYSRYIQTSVHCELYKYLDVTCVESVTLHISDSKVHGANMGPTWVLLTPWTLLSGLFPAMDWYIQDAGFIARHTLREILHCSIVKPVYNDHLYKKNYYLWFIQQCV